MKRQQLFVLALVAIMATAMWAMIAEASYLDPDTGDRYIRPTYTPAVVSIDTATPIPMAYPEPITNTPQPPPPQPPPPTSYPVCLERPAFPCNTPTPGIEPTPTPPWAEGQEGCYVQQDNGLVECGQ